MRFAQPGRDARKHRPERGLGASLSSAGLEQAMLGVSGGLVDSPVALGLFLEIRAPALAADLRRTALQAERHRHASQYYLNSVHPVFVPLESGRGLRHQAFPPSPARCSVPRACATVHWSDDPAPRSAGLWRSPHNVRTGSISQKSLHAYTTRRASARRMWPVTAPRYWAGSARSLMLPPAPRPTPARPTPDHRAC